MTAELSSNSNLSSNSKWLRNPLPSREKAKEPICLVVPFSSAALDQLLFFVSKSWLLAVSLLLCPWVTPTLHPLPCAFLRLKKV